MSASVPAESIRLVGECHIIRLRIAGDPFLNVAHGSDGVTLAELQELHAKRKLTFVSEPERMMRIVIATESSAPEEL